MQAQAQPSIVEAVERTAVELVNRNSLDEVELILCESGVRAELAAKLVLLVPSAFAAAHYEPQGIEFPTHFFVGPEGSMLKLPYAAEPGYLEARALAQRWQAEGRPSLVARVLDWSAESSGIKKAKAQGLTPSRMSSVHHGAAW
jgi:hypothetical protein